MTDDVALAEFNSLVELARQKPAAVEYVRKLKDQDLNIDAMSEQEVLALFESIMAVVFD